MWPLNVLGLDPFVKRAQLPGLVSHLITVKISCRKPVRSQRNSPARLLSVGNTPNYSFARIDEAVRAGMVGQEEAFASSEPLAVLAAFLNN